jgi:FkbM family methyltransferase
MELPDGVVIRVANECREMAVGYEPAVMEAYVAHLSPRSVVVDVGAHWGLYSLTAGARGARAIALEPSEYNASLIRRNVRLSGLGTIDVRQVAVGDTIGEIVFHEYPGRSFGRSMMGGAVAQDFTRPTRVASDTLDAVGADATLVKIDVEGSEAAVLGGASRLLAGARPTILLEVHQGRLEALGSSVGEVRAILDAAAYDVHELSRRVVDDGEDIRHWLGEPQR